MTRLHAVDGAGGDGPADVVVRNPATGALLATLPAASAADVDAAITRARGAHEAWARVPIAARTAVVRAARKAMLRRAAELTAVVVQETGKPEDEASIHEVGVSALQAAWTTAHAARALRPQRVPSFLPVRRTATRTWHPRGVVALITPWNFPLAIPASTLFPALAAGNAVVWKPSELTPLCALKLEEILVDAGVPQGLVQVVVGHGPTGRALLDGDVDFVAFTGSTETGRRVAARCGERLIPHFVELGGKAPAIVLDDAPLERTARALVFGGFVNGGQVCVSVERVFAEPRIHDRLVARVVELTKALRQGDPSAGDVDVGAMTMPRQAEVVRRLVEDARAKGATLHVGRDVDAPDGGTFCAPVVVAGATLEMAVMHDEIFGPVLPIMKVQDADEAVRLANDSRLGLNAYVFGGDAKRARAIAARVRAGSVVVNDVVLNYALPEAPFGGVRDSGLGRVHGDDALRALCEERVIVENGATLLPRDPWWQPFEGLGTRFVRSGLDRALDALEALERARQRLRRR